MAAVILERRGPVALLTLNNPAQYNALHPELLQGLIDSLDAAIASEEVRAIVLTGAGKGFCSGAQFGGGSFSRGAAVGDSIRKFLNPIVTKMRTSRIPIVVAVNGPAAGAGVGLALAGDIVVASRSARFIFSFVRLGAALDGGASFAPQRAIGVARARALALLGEPLSAETAADWGLIWRVVEDEALLEKAMEIAQKLASGPPLAIGMIKQQMESGWSDGLESALEEEAVAQSEAFTTEDLREGAAAFVEKRAPRFRGR